MFSTRRSSSRLTSRGIRLSFLASATATLSALLIAVAPQAANAQITISNPGTSTISPWGITDTASYGQTITAPTGSTKISNFTFTLASLASSTSASIPFRAYVFGYNSGTNTVTGSALFTSAVLNTPTTFPSDITVNTGSTAVTAGSQYLLLFSTSGLQTGQAQTIYNFSSSSTDNYAGGTFAYMNNGDNATLLTTGTYNTTSSAPDLRFTANFNAGGAAAAPEPSGIALLALAGLPAVGMIARRRGHKCVTGHKQVAA